MHVPSHVVVRLTKNLLVANITTLRIPGYYHSTVLDDHCCTSSLGNYFLHVGIRYFTVNLNPISFPIKLAGLQTSLEGL